MELDKSFEPAAIEAHWYPHWEQSGYFKPSWKEGAPPYCIQLPPPNVTGTLHMGHAFQQTIMDALTRYHRMKGYNTLWQVGTDHAGIATQIVVERQLDQQGIGRHDLGRDAFVEKVWEWKAFSGNTITQQMRRLGTSCDWSRERFTMDAGLSDAVKEVFVSLFEQGYLYRGKRLVNWDPQLGTAVSDLEVLSEEEDGFMWYIRYPVADGNGELVVATTRPETLLGDVAVAVNPNDERYAHLVGKTLRLPLVGRLIPIVADDYVDAAFGTGCVKITPAHDFNDWQLGQRHSLEALCILTLDAHINDNAPAAYRGLERFSARRAIVADLEAQGFLVEVKAHKLTVPRGDRTGVVIEPMLTDQWFVKMDDFARDGLALVNEGEVRFVPDNWKTTYTQWLTHIQDWCISRQLWWGHRIPAWYDQQGGIYVARSAEAAAQQAGVAASELTQDDDVLDTWFSSALWCFSTLGWPQKTRELETFLPSSVLVTGFDIIFFWVARMVMFTRPFTQQVPFKDVYVTGLVRDEHGNKMSKSKGNIIDPIDLIDGISADDLVQKRTAHLMNPKQAEKIAKETRKSYPDGFPAFGTDALRFTFASMATHGRDVRFDVKRIEGYRNFCNKLWNATRFVLMNLEGHDCGVDSHSEVELSFVDRWIVARLQQMERAVELAFSTYRFDLAAREIYEFVWDEFCDWYLELSKVQLQGGNAAQQRGTRRTLAQVLETTLRIAHPIMPFITEALWQSVAPLAGRKQTDSIMVAGYPVADASLIDEAALARMAQLKEMINAIRNLRGEMGLGPAQKVPLLIENGAAYLEFAPYMKLLARLADVTMVNTLTNNDAPVAIVADTHLQLVVEIDKAAEHARLSKEISKLEVEISKLAGKLDNASYLEKAPAHLVERDRTQRAELSDKLDKTRVQLAKLAS